MSIEDRIFFVTGASGFIGRHLCARLVEQGAEVRALVRFPVGAGFSIPGVTPVFGNLDDSKS